MTRYGSVIARTVEGSRESCWRALLDEINGRASWWSPYARLEPQGSQPVDRAGTRVRMRVNPYGHVDQHWATSRWVGEIVAFEPPSRLVLDIVSGDVRGSIAWDLAEAGPQRTHVIVQWSGQPAGIARVVTAPVDALTGDGQDLHARVMARGLDGLERHLLAERVEYL